MFFTSCLKFLCSAYLSFALLSNVGYFMMGLLILDPTFSALAVPAIAVVCIATHAALATAFVMYLLVFVCLPFCCLVWLIFVLFFWVCICDTLFVYCLDLLRLPVLSLPSVLCFSLPLWDFYSWHHVVYLTLVKITLMYASIYIYCYVQMNCYLKEVHVIYIHKCSAL